MYCNNDSTIHRYGQEVPSIEWIWRQNFNFERFNFERFKSSEGFITGNRHHVKTITVPIASLPARPLIIIQLHNGNKISRVKYPPTGKYLFPSKRPIQTLNISGKSVPATERFNSDRQCGRRWNGWMEWEGVFGVVGVGGGGGGGGLGGLPLQAESSPPSPTINPSPPHAAPASKGEPPPRRRGRGKNTRHFPRQVVALAAVMGSWHEGQQYAKTQPLALDKDKGRVTLGSGPASISVLTQLAWLI